MAITVTWYGLTLEKMIEQVGADVNLLTGTVKLALVTDAYTPARDTHDFWNDVSGSELANGDGYTTGGETLAGKTITYDAGSDQVRFDHNDVTWTFTAAKTWRYGVYYIDTAGASTTDPLVGLLTWDSNQTVSTAYTLVIDAAGTLYLDTT